MGNVIVSEGSGGLEATIDGIIRYQFNVGIDPQLVEVPDVLVMEREEGVKESLGMSVFEDRSVDSTEVVDSCIVVDITLVGESGASFEDLPVDELDISVDDYLLTIVLYILLNSPASRKDIRVGDIITIFGSIKSTSKFFV